MIIEENFVGKYKQQFYSREVQIQELIKQQKSLLKILDQLHTKTQKYFDKICSTMEKKNNTIESSKNSFSKENTTKLPILVTQAEIKNSNKYIKLLQNEKDKLEKRMEISMVFKQKDMNKQIQQEKQKVLAMIKINKYDKLQIKKLGQKLVQQKSPIKEVYDNLLNQLNNRREENKQKCEKINKNQNRISELNQKITQIDYSLQQNQAPSNEYTNQTSQEYITKMQQKYQTLLKIKQKIKQNVESINKRLSQQYYCKLKQMQNTVKKVQNLALGISNVEEKIIQKNKDVKQNNRKIIV